MDTIFENGVVLAGAPWTPAEALAVRDGRVAAVGRRDEIRPLARAGTRVVDLGGRTLVPGFIDAHAHIWKIGHLLTSLVDLRRAASVGAVTDAVRAHAARRPDDGWVLGRGYNEARFDGPRALTRVELDLAVPDRPVALTRTCAHIMVCNSAALRAAGITAATEDPPGGRIERGEDGGPTGVLHETAMGLVARHVPPPSARDYRTMIERALAHQLAVGITSTTDAGVAPELAGVYRQMDRDGALAARVNVMALAQVDGLGPVPRPERHVSAFLRIDTVKAFADGGLSGATAALSVPYRHAVTRGVLRLERDALARLAAETHAAGWRLSVHAIGDAAIALVLDALATLGPGARGHRIEHFGLPTGADLARASGLGIIVVPQAIFIRPLGRNFRAYLPDALLARAYPVRAMLDAGLTVALSSDAPVVEDDAPLAGMQAAVLRTDDDGVCIAPDQAITMGEALDAYTRAGAAASGDGADRGRLDAGCLADLVVLSGNPLTTPPHALGSVRVDQTWVGGRLAFEA
ncbi:MAG: amidohydrolase [Acidobacteriota bacterium]